jgi:hypothetical protein
VLTGFCMEIYPLSRAFRTSEAPGSVSPLRTTSSHTE